MTLEKDAGRVLKFSKYGWLSAESGGRSWLTFFPVAVASFLSEAKNLDRLCVFAAVLNEQLRLRRLAGGSGLRSWIL